MPVTPRGLGRALFERLRRQLTGPAQSTPDTPDTPEAEEGPGLLDRMRQRFDDLRRPPPAERPPPPRGLGEVKARIVYAGRAGVLLQAAYAAAHGGGPTWRYLEPYSFRYRDADNPATPLLYAHCHIHGHIEAFKLRRFVDLQVTGHKFAPRWPVEFGAIR